MQSDFWINLQDFQIDQTEFLVRLLVATGIGFLIGLEREYSALTQKERRFGGLRTVIIIVLLGFLSAFMGLLWTPWLMLISIMSVAFILALSYYHSASRGHIGGTTEMAILLSFFLGMLTFVGYVRISLAITVLLVIVLSLKVQLHRFVGRITEEELFAFIKFVTLALLILPFLPNEAYGPYEVLNPREVGWVIVLTSGVGFAGYVLMKLVGAGKGIALTGIVGGLVSSTVVTWVFSKKSKESPAYSASCAMAILAASTVMVVRVFVWVYIFNRSLLGGLVLPLLILLFVGLGTVYYFYRRHQQMTIDEELPLGNPLNLRDATVFGILYAGILLLVSYANDYLGSEGLYLSSAVASLTDIDAITISVSKLGGKSVALQAAQNAILIATLGNTIVKIGLSLWFGSREMRRYIMWGYGLVFLAGLIGFGVLNVF